MKDLFLFDCSIGLGRLGFEGLGFDISQESCSAFFPYLRCWELAVPRVHLPCRFLHETDCESPSLQPQTLATHDVLSLVSAAVLDLKVVGCRMCRRWRLLHTTYDELPTGTSARSQVPRNIGFRSCTERQDAAIHQKLATHCGGSSDSAGVQRAPRRHSSRHSAPRWLFPCCLVFSTKSLYSCHQMCFLIASRSFWVPSFGSIGL